MGKHFLPYPKFTNSLGFMGTLRVLSKGGQAKNLLMNMSSQLILCLWIGPELWSVYCNIIRADFNFFKF
jgi:hypothetical protein